MDKVTLLSLSMDLKRITQSIQRGSLENAGRFSLEAKKWLKDFCVNRRYTNFKFGIGHFYFSAFFKVREQWWYVSSGDLRWSFGTMLVRTANSDKDYTGGRNQSVYYNENFEANLYKIVKGD